MQHFLRAFQCGLEQRVPVEVFKDSLNHRIEFSNKLIECFPCRLILADHLYFFHIYLMLKMACNLPWYCFNPDLLIIQFTHNFENGKALSFAEKEEEGNEKGFNFCFHYLCFSLPQCRQIPLPGLFTLLQQANTEPSKLRQMVFIILCQFTGKKNRKPQNFEVQVIACLSSLPSE